MKYSEEITQEICKYLRAGNSQHDSALLSGIAESTFYEWLKEPEFSEGIKKAEYECKARNIAIIQKAAEKSWQAAAWYLERKYNAEFALKQINEIGGPLNANGEREPIRLLVNAGQGFVPATVALQQVSNGSAPSGQSSVQSPNLAPESSENLHSDNGDSKAGTSP